MPTQPGPACSQFEKIGQTSKNHNYQIVWSRAIRLLQDSMNLIEIYTGILSKKNPLYELAGPH